MRPELIIELDVAVEPLLWMTNCLICTEMDLLMLGAPPEEPIRTDPEAPISQ